LLLKSAPIVTDLNESADTETPGNDAKKKHLKIKII